LKNPNSVGGFTPRFDLKLAAFRFGVAILVLAKRALRARVNLLFFLSSSEEEDEEDEEEDVSESDSPS